MNNAHRCWYCNESTDVSAPATIEMNNIRHWTGGGINNTGYNQSGGHVEISIPRCSKCKEAHDRLALPLKQKMHLAGNSNRPPISPKAIFTAIITVCACFLGVCFAFLWAGLKHIKLHDPEPLIYGGAVVIVAWIIGMIWFSDNRTFVNSRMRYDDFVHDIEAHLLNGTRRPEEANDHPQVREARGNGFIYDYTFEFRPGGYDPYYHCEHNGKYGWTYVFDSVPQRPSLL